MMGERITISTMYGMSAIIYVKQTMTEDGAHSCVKTIPIYTHAHTQKWCRVCRPLICAHSQRRVSMAYMFLHLDYYILLRLNSIFLYIQTYVVTANLLLLYSACC